MPAETAQPVVPDIAPRYLAQLKRLAAIHSLHHGSYPARIEVLDAWLAWRPIGQRERPWRTCTPEEVGGIGKAEIGYLPPAPDSAPQLWYWSAQAGSKELTLSVEPLDPVSALAARDLAELQEQSTLTALATLGKQDAELALKRMLWLRLPREAAPAAAAHFALRALLEHVVTVREGAWPDTEAELWGNALGRPGSFPGLTIWWDRDQDTMWTRFTFPELDAPWLVETKVIQVEGRTQWVSVSYTVPDDPQPGTDLWRVM